MLQPRGAGNGQEDRAALENPGKRDLRRRCLVRLCDAVEDRAGLRQIAGRQRKPRDEADALFRAIIEHGLAGAIDQIVAVLYGRHRKDFSGGFDVRDRDFAQPGMADQLVVQQRLDRAELFVARHFRVDAVQLPQADLLQMQEPQAHHRLLPQIFGTPERMPLTGACAHQTTLRGNQNVLVGMKCLVDQVLGNIGTVGISSVNEIDAEFWQMRQRAQAFLAVRRFAPDALAGDLHRSEAETIDGNIFADFKGAGLGGGQVCHRFPSFVRGGCTDILAHERRSPRQWAP